MTSRESWAELLNRFGARFERVSLGAGPALALRAGELASALVAAGARTEELAPLAESEGEDLALVAEPDEPADPETVAERLLGDPLARSSRWLALDGAVVSDALLAPLAARASFHPVGRVRVDVGGAPAEVCLLRRGQHGSEPARIPRRGRRFPERPEDLKRREEHFQRRRGGPKC